MEHTYLQSLIYLAKKDLGIYELNAQDFGKINTLFIKNVLNKENANLFIQLVETKNLYLPVISASFLLMYEKNYKQSIESEFEVGDKIYWKPQCKTYLVIEKNAERYILNREYDETNRLGQVDHQEERCHPRIKGIVKKRVVINSE